MAGQMADPTAATKAGNWAEHLADQMAAHSVGLKVALKAERTASQMAVQWAEHLVDQMAAHSVDL